MGKTGAGEAGAMAEAVKSKLVAGGAVGSTDSAAGAVTGAAASTRMASTAAGPRDSSAGVETAAVKPAAKACKSGGAKDSVVGAGAAKSTIVAGKLRGAKKSVKPGGGKDAVAVATGPLRPQLWRANRVVPRTPSSRAGPRMLSLWRRSVPLSPPLWRASWGWLRASGPGWRSRRPEPSSLESWQASRVIRATR